MLLLPIYFPLNSIECVLFQVNYVKQNIYGIQISKKQNQFIIHKYDAVVIDNILAYYPLEFYCVAFISFYEI